MQITAVETIQLDEFPNLLWVHVHTDEGLVGLGETFFGPNAVAAYIHETRSAAPARPGSAGDRPAFAHAAGQLRRLLGQRRRDARRSRRSTSRSGTSSARRPASRSTSCWAACRARASASTTPAPAIATCARTRPADRQLGPAAGRPGRARTRTSTRSCTAPTSLPQSLLEQGITGMKIWPFDFAAEALGRPLHQPGRARPGARAVPQDPQRGRRPHGHHGRAPLAVEPADRQADLPARSRSSSRSGSRTRSR